MVFATSAARLSRPSVCSSSSLAGRNLLHLQCNTITSYKFPLQQVVGQSIRPVATTWAPAFNGDKDAKTGSSSHDYASLMDERVPFLLDVVFVAIQAAIFTCLFAIAAMVLLVAVAVYFFLLGEPVIHAKLIFKAASWLLMYLVMFPIMCISTAQTAIVVLISYFPH